ncbi:MAG TPA: hypothetical protein VKV41_07570 [Methylomirabilota bacterium]|nr:hypothetical protein [Methylomirabilota bacterium]
MSERRIPRRGFQIAIVLTVLFNLLALLVMIHTTPILFTLFMFVGQPLFVLALALLVGAVVADLREKQLL